MREIGSFIVRVYRRDAGSVSGVVEDVRTGHVHAFHDVLDLWLVLLRPRIDDHPGKQP